MGGGKGGGGGRGLTRAEQQLLQAQTQAAEFGTAQQQAIFQQAAQGLGMGQVMMPQLLGDIQAQRAQLAGLVPQAGFEGARRAGMEQFLLGQAGGMLPALQANIASIRGMQTPQAPMMMGAPPTMAGVPRPQLPPQIPTGAFGVRRAPLMAAMSPSEQAARAAEAAAGRQIPSPEAFESKGPLGEMPRQVAAGEQMAMQALMGQPTPGQFAPTPTPQPMAAQQPMAAPPMQVPGAEAAAGLQNIAAQALGGQGALQSLIAPSRSMAPETLFRADPRVFGLSNQLAATRAGLGGIAGQLQQVAAPGAALTRIGQQAEQLAQQEFGQELRPLAVQALQQTLRGEAPAPLRALQPPVAGPERDVLERQFQVAQQRVRERGVRGGALQAQLGGLEAQRALGIAQQEAARQRQAQAAQQDVLRELISTGVTQGLAAPTQQLQALQLAGGLAGQAAQQQVAALGEAGRQRLGEAQTQIQALSEAGRQRLAGTQQRVQAVQAGRQLELAEREARTQAIGAGQRGLALAGELTGQAGRQAMAGEQLRLATLAQEQQAIQNALASQTALAGQIGAGADVLRFQTAPGLRQQLLQASQLGVQAPGLLTQLLAGAGPGGGGGYGEAARTLQAGLARQQQAAQFAAQQRAQALQGGLGAAGTLAGFAFGGPMGAALGSIAGGGLGSIFGK